MSFGQSGFAAGVAIAFAILSVILSIGGGIYLYVGFLNKKNEGKFTGLKGWLYDFLNFKELLAETILRIIYLINACLVTLASFACLFTGIGGVLLFPLVLILGNASLRLVYEFALIFLIICRNTTEINKKLGTGTSPAGSPDSAPFSAPNSKLNLSEIVKGIKNTDNSNSWQCKKCGTLNPNGSIFCKDCGEYV